VKLTTQLHLVQKLRMCGVITTLPQYVFTAWCFVKHEDRVLSIKCQRRVVSDEIYLRFIHTLTVQLFLIREEELLAYIRNRAFFLFVLHYRSLEMKQTFRNWN